MQARALLLLQGLLLHITAGIKSGHRHAVSRIALHLSLSHLHTRIHSRRKCASRFNSLCQQDNLDLVKTVKQDGGLEFSVLRQDYMSSL